MIMIIITKVFSFLQTDDGDLSDSNFLGLIQTLLKDPDEMEHFFQDVFPVEFGPKYDAAIEKLMCQFLSRLEKLLPVSNFQQAAFLLSDVPSVLEECVESMSHPQQLKTLLQYHRDLGQLDNHGGESHLCMSGRHISVDDGSPPQAEPRQDGAALPPGEGLPVP
ncbi:uncharacterized protein ACWYII_024584 isoform 3-T6 [Salvelinus alpinus]